ncbi:universal stress protein [Desulfonema ishimotonii]|uniref:Universal stress protein n=1 Tax=Desulfonema ishimotonii TaxID=45657 RepID=A0A401FXG6_9BACT|nr:universal stress protein [Desulfonema ishimotonii]GBC61639.1 universal stress protein [Desulfonema ishimotonii]
MEVRKILWPTDFSSSAEKALPHVKSLTEKYSAEIHVVYVVEDTAHHDPWYGVFDEDHVNRIVEYGQKVAGERLGQICKKYLEGCPLYIRHIAMGDPAQEILKLIGYEKIDMVVMTTRGQEGLFPFGSVTEKVVKNSPVPVITVPILKEETETEA